MVRASRSLWESTYLPSGGSTSHFLYGSFIRSPSQSRIHAEVVEDAPQGRPVRQRMQNLDFNY